MDGDILYVQELRATFACKEVDGFYRRWAKSWLEEIRYQDVLLNQLKDYPVPVMGGRSHAPDVEASGVTKLVTLSQ